MKKIQSKEITAVDVMLSLAHAAWAADVKCNCVTEFLFEAALERAKELDASFARNGLVGPLHGVGMSVKDHIDVTGVDSSAGYSKYCFQPATEDALIVTALQKAGAVILCKTNVMQTMKAFECSNPIFGTTLHPKNPRYSSGGSSGGEAALVSLGGSTIGIGSDDGGSIRMPAHFCGLYGLRPSSLRLPQIKVKLNHRGNDSLCDSFGPLARSVDDIDLVVKTLVDMDLNDPSIVPLPYRPVAKKEKYNVGYFVSNGLCRPTPPCTRAVTETVEKLKNAGHRVTELKFPRALEATTTFLSLASMDGYRRYMSDLTTDPVDPAVQQLLLLTRLPDWVKSLLSLLLRVLGLTVESYIITASKSLSLQQMWNAHAWRNDYAYEIAHLFRPYDFVICPVNCQPPIKHGAFPHMPFAASYTFLFNLVDMPAGVVPVTTVDPVRDSLTSTQLSRFEQENMFGYDPIDADGLPVGIQVICQRYQEESCIDAMRLLGNLWK